MDFSELAGGNANCLGCGWMGLAEHLLLVKGAEGQHLLLEGKLEQMMGDLRLLLSGELGLPYLKFLLRWGFLQGDIQHVAETLDRKKFARYLSVIAKSILMAIIEERVSQAIEMAKKRAPS